MNRAVLISAAAFLFLVSLSSHAQTAPPNYTLAFSDNLSSSALDPSKWNYRTDAKALSAQLPANVGENGGYVDIDLAQQAGFSWSGGGIVSKDSFRYGYHQVKAKITANPGWHTSFWVFAGNGTTTYTPTAKTEIDGFEINTDNPSSISMGYIEWNNGSSVGERAVIAATIQDSARRQVITTTVLNGPNPALRITSTARKSAPSRIRRRVGPTTRSISGLPPSVTPPIFRWLQILPPIALPTSPTMCAIIT